MTGEANKAIVLDLIDKWATPESLDYLSDDFEFVFEADPSSFPWAGTYNKEQMAEAWSRDIEEDRKLNVKSAVAEESKVAVEIFMTCLVRKEPWSLRCHFAFELRDGKVVRIGQYADTARIVQSAADRAVDMFSSPESQ